MKEFVKNHKKQCLIGGLIFLVIFLIILVWLFIVPLFGNNKYGDRLDGVKAVQVSKDELIRRKKLGF